VKEGIVTQEQYEQYRTRAEAYAADVAATGLPLRM